MHIKMSLIILVMIIIPINSKATGIYINGKKANLKFQNYGLEPDGKWRLDLIDESGQYVDIPNGNSNGENNNGNNSGNNDDFIDTSKFALVNKKFDMDAPHGQYEYKAYKDKIIVLKFKTKSEAIHANSVSITAGPGFSQHPKEVWIAKTPTSKQNDSRNVCIGNGGENISMSWSTNGKRGYRCDVTPNTYYYLHIRNKNISESIVLVNWRTGG